VRGAVSNGRPYRDPFRSMNPRAKFSDNPKVGSNVRCVWCSVGSSLPSRRVVPWVKKFK
jgi:hypothetical protein